MKKKLFFIITIFFMASLIICQSTNFTLENLYKEIFNNNYEIIENGVKVQYYTTNGLLKEKDKIINILSLKDYDEKVAEGSIYINANKDNAKFEIKGTLSDKGNFLEIQVIEKNDRININELQQNLYKIKDDCTENEQYFTFTKGKLIKNSDEKIRLENLLKEKKAKQIETIPISSGITSIAKLKNKFQVNYSLCSYNSGTYLIIGTPIIFVEY